MASSALFTLVVLACSLASVSAQVIGGASSINQYVPACIRSYSGRSAIGSYASVGSGAGISGFIGKTYLIGCSDDPLTSSQRNQAVATLRSTVFHLPLTLATYSFCTRKAAGLRVTGATMARVYLGQVTVWRSINSGLSGTIVPVARSDGSGTTKLFGEYFFAEYRGWPASARDTRPFAQTGIRNSRIVYRSGSGGVASYTASNANAVCYVQSGIGATQYKLRLMAVKSPYNSNYILATQADPQQSIPRPLPASSSDWASVSLLRTRGTRTYPIASFAYMFARRTYGGTRGRTVRLFLAYLMTGTPQNLAASYFFFRLPTDVIRLNNNAIRLIA